MSVGTNLLAPVKERGMAGVTRGGGPTQTFTAAWQCKEVKMTQTAKQCVIALSCVVCGWVGLGTIDNSHEINIIHYCTYVRMYVCTYVRRCVRRCVVCK